LIFFYTFFVEEGGKRGDKGKRSRSALRKRRRERKGAHWAATYKPFVIFFQRRRKREGGRERKPA